jgi:hypothetical protein
MKLKNREPKNFSRRDFLKTSTAGVGAVALAGLAAPARQQPLLRQGLN